jgi:YD repeat-containing protein
MAESESSTESTSEEEKTEVVSFGLWWPAGDPDKLREAATAWDDMASHLETATTTLTGAASTVTQPNTGAAINAFHGHWQRTGGPEGALPTIAGHCRTMATACREFADEIDEARKQILQLAAEIVASVAIGVGLAFFTAGISAAAVTATTARIVGLATQIGVNVGFRAATIISRVAVIGAVGSVESMATNTIVQLGRNVVLNENHNPFDGFSFSEVAASGAFGFATGGTIAGIQGLRQAFRTGGNQVSRATDDLSKARDPVDVAAGRVVLTQTDVELAGVLALVVGRTHLSSYRVGRWFGPSWASTLDQKLEIDDTGVYYAAEDGMLLAYSTPAEGATVVPEEGPRWSLRRSEDGGYTITDPQRGHTLHFASNNAAQPAVLPLRAITDRNEHRIELGYDQGGTLIEIRHSGGYRIGVETTGGRITALRLRGADSDSDVVLVRYAYDGIGRLTQVTNSSGIPLRFDYDTAGRLTSWQDRNDFTYHYTYDELGRCVRTSGTSGYMNGTLTYDPNARITVVTDSLGHPTTFHLNERGQVVREIDPLGQTTVSEWNRYDELLARTDPLGRTTRYTYDEVGNLVAITRPDGSEILTEYNDLRLPITVIDPDGAVWRRTYDGRGNLTSVTDPLGATTHYAYDDQGHLATVTDALGYVCRSETNAAGLPTAVTDPLGATTHYARDAFGRLTAVTDPVGGVTRLGWTTEGKPAWRVLPDGATERWSYDGEGNLVEHVDALGQVTRTEIGPFDLPTAQVGPDGARLEFAYDTELRLTSVTNPQGLIWRYDYDPAGSLIQETDFNHRELRYVHDTAGQLIERTNGTGQTTHFAWDPLDNVVEQRSGDAVTTFGYDATGRLVRAANADAEVSFNRDALGRIVAETCNGRTLTSSYDALGRRTHRRTPSGAESYWEYGADEVPVALHTAGRTLRFGYDPAGREIQRHLGTGAVLAQTWDANHRLVSQTLTASRPGAGRSSSAREARLVQRRSYGYRPDGYLTEIDDHFSGTRRFDLDPAGRVTAVHGAGWTERYAYDPAGNITDAAWPAPPHSESLNADSRGGREYAGTLIRRAGNVRYQHDAQGRITLRQQKRLSASPTPGTTPGTPTTV